MVADAYRATPVEILQAETMVPLMQEYLDQLQTKARLCLKAGKQGTFIK